TRPSCTPQRRGSIIVSVNPSARSSFIVVQGRYDPTVGRPSPGGWNSPSISAMLPRLTERGGPRPSCSNEPIRPPALASSVAWPRLGLNSTGLHAAPRLTSPCYTRFSTPESSPMSRNKFYALLVIAALSIAVGGLACGDSLEELDKLDETYGAT